MKPDTLPAGGWLYWTVIGTTCMHVEQCEVYTSILRYSPAHIPHEKN